MTLCAITRHDSGCAGAVVGAGGNLLVVDQAPDPMSNMEGGTARMDSSVENKAEREGEWCLLEIAQGLA